MVNASFPQGFGEAYRDPWLIPCRQKIARHRRPARRWPRSTASTISIAMARLRAASRGTDRLKGRAVSGFFRHRHLAQMPPELSPFPAVPPDEWWWAPTTRQSPPPLSQHGGRRKPTAAVSPPSFRYHKRNVFQRIVAPGLRRPTAKMFASSLNVCFCNHSLQHIQTDFDVVIAKRPPTQHPVPAVSHTGRLH